MLKKLHIQFEQAVRLLGEHLPISQEDSRKPALFHDIRVGVYLYEQEYSPNIVLGGLLHDALEWSTITEELLKTTFGDAIAQLVRANTKDDSILDKQEKTNELIKRCVENGQDALIIKAADIIDSFKWYSNQDNTDQLTYCIRNANAIFKFKPDNFEDKIFIELKKWQDKYHFLKEI